MLLCVSSMSDLTALTVSICHCVLICDCCVIFLAGRETHVHTEDIK